jgi:phosphoribosylaminoimidazole-succinocarboxamide synthase
MGCGWLSRRAKLACEMFAGQFFPEASARWHLALGTRKRNRIICAMPNETVLQLDLPGIKKVKSGKVREIFDLGDSLLLVASDRLSAFDVVLPNGIPRKGEVLTQISHFWFEKFSGLVPNHLLAKANDPLPANLQPFADKLSGRSMIVKKAKPLAIECIVRGYLSGSGLKEYKKSETVCGIKLPPGLAESAELPEPIFTPSTKAEAGHDENISFDEAKKIVGEALATEARDLSLKIYKAGRDYARQRGIIIADTKFEFGIFDGQLILIDEVLTPDSSRFWPADQYVPGKSQPSFDKQFVRDYLETLTWDKTPPGPVLPDEVVAKTSAKYLEAYEKLTGKKL